MAAQWDCVEVELVGGPWDGERQRILHQTMYVAMPSRGEQHEAGYVTTAMYIRARYGRMRFRGYVTIPTEATR